MRMKHFYTFHDPAPSDAPHIDRARQIVAIKEGIAWWALPVPLLWLLWHRLWWALALYVFAAIAVAVVTHLLPLGAAAVFFIGALFNVAVALIGNDLRRAALARKGFAEVAAIRAGSLRHAECIFFEAWAKGETRFAAAEPDVPQPVQPILPEPAS
jgi:hypothetical protein